MKPRSQPRYRASDMKGRPPKKRKLVLRRTTPGRFWLGLFFRWGVLYTLLPLALLWIGNLFLNPYRVYFDAKPSNVTLDGSPVALDSANGFDLSRFSSGEHLVRYVDAQGAAKTVRMHARLSDENGELAITDRHVSGIPKSEFVPENAPSMTR